MKRQELSASDQEELDQLQKRSVASNVVKKTWVRMGEVLVFGSLEFEESKFGDFESTNKRCKKIERNKIPC